MIRCVNCGRSYEPGFFRSSTFCCDGCEKEYAIKTRTLEMAESSHDDCQEWKKSVLMIAEATLGMLPSLRDQFTLWANCLCQYEKDYFDAFRDNVIAGKLFERVILAESNLEPALLNEIRKWLGDWDSEKAQRQVDERKIFVSKFTEGINQQLSDRLEMFNVVEKNMPAH
jgi:hypothetical protein